MGGREQGAQGGPLQIAADGRALRPGGVQDGQDILHGVLQDDRSGRVIREPGTALVEHNQPGERHQPRIPADHTRPLVVLLQMGGERWNQDQVHRSVTEHPIGDVDTAAVDIPNLGTSHRATTKIRHSPDLPAASCRLDGKLSIQQRCRPCQWLAQVLEAAIAPAAD
jgi:hypothetical protein